MPYVDKELRDEVDYHLDGVLDDLVALDNPGLLNYAITRLCVGYLPKDAGYKNFNEVLGVLDAVAREYYRRVVVPYEEKKRTSNGDVYNA